MVIQIDPKKMERLQKIAKATGRSVEQVIDTAIDRAIEEQSPFAAERKMTPERKAAILARIDEIRNLPRQSPDDGFTPEDHDKVIYRIDW